jgi:hypothetical protein
MKKIYTYPIIEIQPFCAMTALCESEVQDGLGGGNTGANPWTGGRAPRRTAPF